MTPTRLTVLALLSACGGEIRKMGADSGSSASDPPVTTDADADADGSPPSDSGQDSAEPVIPTPCADRSNPAALDASVCVDTAPCRWDGADAYSQFGFAISGDGDVDGDGIRDLVVGAPLSDLFPSGGDPILDAGKVHIYRGFNLPNHFEADALIEGRHDGAYLGISVDIVPDLNGDDLDEVVVGARGDGPEDRPAAGSVTLSFGRRDGWEEPIWDADSFWYGERTYSRFGTTVRGAEDINGDGFGELMLTGELKELTASGYETYTSGRVILLGGSHDFADVASPGMPTATIDGVGSSDGAGLATGSGDVNGDGHADLIVSAPYGSSNRGRVVVFPGGPEGITGPLTLDDAPVSIDGDSPGDAFGWSVAAGDLGGDGGRALVVGAPLADGSYPSSGKVMVFAGASDFFDGTPDARTTFSGEFDDHQLGTDVAVGSDINGDGVGDLMMGAVNAWKGIVTKGGRVYAIHGPLSGWAESSSAREATIQLHGGASKDYLGRAITTGDLDRDGKHEIIVGSGYTNVGDDTDVGSVYLFWGE